jgi:phosphatidylserine/phosphatidylglycerophosphate/cardiolipin synthase-like enzyme
MRLMYPVLALTLVACTRSGAEHDDDASDVDAGPDGPAGVGCTPTSPRSVAPEAFVGPTGLQSRITGFIDDAQQTLDVAMYLFTVDAIADRLVSAKQRGVAVRVLFDPDHEGNSGARSTLTSGGVQHRNAPSLYSFSHAKYMVADGATALIMSANFNVDAMSSERNYGIIDRDADDVADLQAIFEMDWAAGGGEPPKPADLACTRLVVSPNNSKTRLIELIDSATATLEVEALYVSELGVRDAIGRAKQRGAEVRVILEATSDNAETRSYFTGLGIPVHDTSTFYNHAKLIIADGVVFVGSENFSQTALTRNREVGALVFEPAPAQVIRQQFDTDWSNTSP